MSFIAVGAVVVGVGAGVAGTAMSASAAKKKKSQVEGIANTPGLDISGLTSEALAGQERFLPQASRLARTEALDRQSLVNDLMEKSMPGFTGLRDKATGVAGDFMSGNIPSDVTDLVQRSAAARALGGGYGGSGAHRNLVARDLGLTSLGLKSQGLSWLNTLRGISPTVTPVNALSLSGPGPNDLINVRGAERAQRMNLLAQAAGLPGSKDIWGGFLQETGGTLFGAGLGGLGGMGGNKGKTQSVKLPTGSRYEGAVWSDEFL